MGSVRLKLMRPVYGAVGWRTNLSPLRHLWAEVEWLVGVGESIQASLKEGRGF